jgi:tRNA A-37 threonylcarbamoyl transferase component Bud32/dienelactone hydrolase
MTEITERLSTALADRYRIERELGAGGMATVYLAEDLKHKRKVAVKVLRPELAATLGPERFLREIEIAAGLTHPHILPLYDSGEANGFLYYVMPYVEGESLRDRLNREKQLPVEDAMKIASEVADALNSAHKHDVIHRDIKPENILLEEGHAVVADFGIARAVRAAGGEKLTTAGVVLGTPVYMAPEQVVADPKVDHRADIYALGVLAYEMLAGRPPITGDSMQALMTAHMTQEPTPLTEVVDSIPEPLAAAVMRCLEKDPDDRWATADEFLGEVRTVLMTPPAGLASVGERRSRPVWLLAVAGAAVVAIAGWGFGQWKQTADLRWAQRVAIPGIEEMVLADDLFGAWLLSREVDERAPGDAGLDRIRDRFEINRGFETLTDGITIMIRRAGDPESEWITLGRSPLSQVSVARGYVAFRLEKDGYLPREGIGAASRIERASQIEPEGSEIAARLLGGMELIPPGQTNIHLPGLDHLEQLALGPYLIGRFEVTNEEFKEFVDAGGYARQDYWEHPFVWEGRELTFEGAVARFVDRTGRLGPSTWEAGDYPDGEDELPVQGVSWYEAAAYARFRGQDLPTVYHWARAADTYQSSRIVPESNIGGRDGAVPVSDAGGMGPFGTVGMAGNVREWCANSDGSQRYTLGGGYSDEPYGFTDAFAQPPFDRSEINGIRLVEYLDDEGLDVASGLLERPFRDILAETPVSDEIFSAYRATFDYDATPVDAVVEAVDDSHEDWVRETISFETAYGERMSVYLYLPRRASPPYQTIVYYPGSGALVQRDFERYGTERRVDFFLKSGRALAFPVYKGTFDRGTGLSSDYADESTLWKDHVVAWVQDYRRTVDYLLTRDDIDGERLAYFGVSWGGYMGAIIPALEPRLKASVLYVGGLLQQRARPEVEPVNFLPRITLPTLMLNGRYDHYYPVETSQRPLFELLGTPAEHKDWQIYEGGHNVPTIKLISETLDWLDRYLGPVN